jgi:hypothetical protein
MKETLAKLREKGECDLGSLSLSKKKRKHGHKLKTKSFIGSETS